jgi:hypothetical protein
MADVDGTISEEGLPPCRCGHTAGEHDFVDEGSTPCRLSLGDRPVCDCTAFAPAPDEPS